MGCFSGVTSSQFHSSRARQYRYRYIVPNTLPIPTSHPPYQGLHLVSAPLFGVLRGLGRCSGGVLDLLYAQYTPMLSTKTLVLRMVSGTEYHTYRVCVHTLRYCVWDILSHLLSLWCRVPPVLVLVLYQQYQQLVSQQQYQQLMTTMYVLAVGVLVTTQYLLQQHAHHY